MVLWIAGVAVLVVVIGVVAFLSGRKDEGTTSAPAAAEQPALSWTVTNVTRETPTTVSFEVNASMSFVAGQFVLIRPTAELPWRAYSFSRAPGEPLRLTVRHVPSGVVSTHVTSQLKTGDVMEVKGPYGQFVLPPGAKSVVLLAGGSGVTPMISMLRDLDQKGWPSNVTLVDGNRSSAEIILKAELDALEAKSGGKLKVIHVLDDATTGLKGPLTADVLTKVLENVGMADAVGLCGPTPMMDAARGVVAKKWPAVKVLEEKFSGDASVAADAKAHTVTLVNGNKQKTFAVRDGEAVLAAARKGKVSMQAGCEMGACGTCRVKVLSGKIETPQDACLSDDERASGYALVCVGKTNGDCSIEPAP